MSYIGATLMILGATGTTDRLDIAWGGFVLGVCAVSAGSMLFALAAVRIKGSTALGIRATDYWIRGPPFDQRGLIRLAHRPLQGCMDLVGVRAVVWEG